MWKVGKRPIESQAERAAEITALQWETMPDKFVWRD
jgi:hypothetical protein